MDKSKLSSKLDGIISKMHTILQGYMQLEAQYLELVEEKKALNEKVLGYEAQILELKEQTKVLKLSKGVNLSGKDNSEVKATINEFIREIDKCIALLND